MRWFEFIREANESFDFEKYIDEHWESIPDEERIWEKISCEPLDEGFIERHDTLVDWQRVSKCSKLSSAFMDRYANCLHWESISRYQTLTMDFMERHRYELDWNIVLPRYQCKEAMIVSMINDPFVTIDLGVILSTQSSLRPDTVSLLSFVYRKKEIERNLALHPKETTPAPNTVEVEEKPRRRWFKNRKKKEA